MQLLNILTDSEGNNFPIVAKSLERAIELLTLKSLSLADDEAIVKLQSIGDPFQIIKEEWEANIVHTQTIPVNNIKPFKNIINEHTF